MNKLYETQEDRDNEERIIKAISERYNISIVMCPPQYQFDAVVIKNGEVDTMLEIKTRTISSKTYPTAIIGLNKVLHAHNIKAATNISCNLIVEWDDMVGMIDIRRFSKVTVGGRSDRGDPRDNSLVAHYPIKHFKTLDLF